MWRSYSHKSTPVAHVLLCLVCVTLQVVSLLVSSHYKNTPNDLLLLADAPAHQLFVLLGPVDETQNAMPDVLAVVQVRGCWVMLLRVARQVNSAWCSSGS